MENICTKPKALLNKRVRIVKRIRRLFEADDIAILNVIKFKFKFVFVRGWFAFESNVFLLPKKIEYNTSALAMLRTVGR